MENYWEKIDPFYKLFSKKRKNNDENKRDSTKKLAKSSYITLPFISPSQLNSDVRWGEITSALIDLKFRCVQTQILGLEIVTKQCGDAKYWLKNSIVKYYPQIEARCNFKIIEEDGVITWKIIKLLPSIIDHALSLPKRLGKLKGIEILEHGTNRTIVLRRNVICSLLANAFLSTFPKQESRHRLNFFNFWRMFHGDENEQERFEVKREKLKCILEYFEQMEGGNRIPDSNISFSRRYVPERIEWTHCTKQLSIMSVEPNKNIEEAKGMLQVDFANRIIGGGVLTTGAVQEEIRFCINPELLVARMFTQSLSCDEVIVIKGTRQFSSYTGYGSSFQFKKPNIDMSTRLNEPIDDLGREGTQIVAMDAVDFPRDQSMIQFRKDMIDRELHKSYIAFRSEVNNEVKGVATGNWGCGVFNGDPQLKFLIQWMAASENEVPVIYHSSNEIQQNELIGMNRFLTSRKITVGVLYKLVTDYEESAGQYESLFDYIETLLK